MHHASKGWISNLKKKSPYLAAMLDMASLIRYELMTPVAKEISSPYQLSFLFRPVDSLYGRVLEWTWSIAFVAFFNRVANCGTTSEYVVKQRRIAKFQAALATAENFIACKVKQWQRLWHDVISTLLDWHNSSATNYRLALKFCTQGRSQDCVALLHKFNLTLQNITYVIVDF